MWRTAQFTDYMACTHAMGIIIKLLNLSSRGEFWEAPYLSDRVCSRGCQESATKEEMYPVKTGNIDGSVKNHGAVHSCSL